MLPFSRNPLSRSAASVFALLACLPGASTACGQKSADVPSTAQTVSTDGLPRWATFDFELRGRTEAQTAISYQPYNTQLYELTRVRGGINLQAPKYVSLYLQFHDEHALGLPLSYVASNMRDQFDLRQAYLKFQSKGATFMAGRQELRLGDERLIGISNWANVSRTFDVVHATLGDEKNHWDVFSGSVVTMHPTALDRPQGGFSLHGAYGTLTTVVPHMRLEPYVLLHTPAVTSQQGLHGREILVAPGIHATGTLPGGFDYKAEGVIERGSYANNRMHAGGGYAMAGYTANWLPWAPRIQPEYDYATGNPHRNPNRVSTFDQFYPSNHDVFGLVDLFGWKNIKQRRLNLSARPRKNLYILLQGESLHVANTHDAVYGSAGTSTVAAPAGGFSSDDIGSEFDASADFAGPHHLVYELGVGHFWPGALMTAHTHGAPLTLAYFQITYKFKVSKPDHTGPHAAL